MTVNGSHPPVMWAGVTSEDGGLTLLQPCVVGCARVPPGDLLPNTFRTGSQAACRGVADRGAEGVCNSACARVHVRVRHFDRAVIHLGRMTQRNGLELATREACTCTFSHGCDSSDLPPHVPSLEHGRNTQASISGSTRCHPVYLSLYVPPPLQYAIALFVALSPSGLLWSPAAVWASNMFERCAPTPQRVPSSSSNKKVQRLTAAFRCHLLQALLSVKRPFRWHHNWSLKWNIDDINPQMCSASVVLLSVATVKDLHNFIQF